MRRIRPIPHEAQVSLVDHLDELRARIVVSLAVFGVALALCFWQNHLLLEVANAVLPASHKKLITFGITESRRPTRRSSVRSVSPTAWRWILQASPA